MGPGGFGADNGAGSGEQALDLFEQFVADEIRIAGVLGANLALERLDDFGGDLLADLAAEELCVEFEKFLGDLGAALTARVIEQILDHGFDAVHFLGEADDGGVLDDGAFEQLLSRRGSSDGDADGRALGLLRRLAARLVAGIAKAAAGGDFDDLLAAQAQPAMPEKCARVENDGSGAHGGFDLRQGRAHRRSLECLEVHRVCTFTRSSRPGRRLQPPPPARFRCIPGRQAAASRSRSSCGPQRECWARRAARRSGRPG